MARDSAEQLPELVAASLLHLVAEEVRRHLCAPRRRRSGPVGLLELRLHVVVTGELVEAGDDDVLLGEGIAAQGSLDGVAGDDLEREPELERELVLPLL